MILVHNQAKALSKMCSPSSSLLKFDLQTTSEDDLYDKDDLHHRLSTSSDVPGIEGKLVLQGCPSPDFEKGEEPLDSEAESDEGSDQSQKGEGQASSDCRLS